MDSPIVSRLAPTPSGYLHLGNAYNFLLNWLWARAVGGKVLLRIDDLDATRVRDEYLDDVFLTLDWLGLDWDIGPAGVDDFKKNWSQTLRVDDYRNTLKRLIEKNKLFACACTRKLLEGTSMYPRTCNHKNIPLDTPDVAWRLHIDESATSVFRDRLLGPVSFATGKQAGCAVMRRRDGIPAYHVASLTDDIRFGITRIARGMDLLPSTALQLYLAQCLDEPAFPRIQFLHHPLVSDAQGHKLSKSAGHTSLRHLREKGWHAADLIRSFAAWQGLQNADHAQTVNDLCEIWNDKKWTE